MIPKVKFSVLDYSREVGVFASFLYSKSVMANYIYKKYPEVKKYLDFSLDRSAFIRKVGEFVSKFREDHVKELETKVDEYQKEWDIVGAKYLSALSKVLEQPWSKDRKLIKGEVSINPVCPRFLDTWSFNVYFSKRTKGVIETIAHEICHFLYFEKWKQTFPDCDEKTFNTPYIEWHLSEILVGVILNDTRIKAILNVDAKVYEWYHTAKIGKVSVYDYFERLYKKHIESGKRFSEFLILAYSRAKKYSNEIKNAEKLFQSK